jgi:endoglucanase
MAMSLTSSTEKRYATDLAANRYNSANAATAFTIPSGFSWGTVAALGRLDLATVPNSIPNRKAIVQSIFDAADAYVALQKESSNGYGVLLRNYPWGSNSNHLNSIQVSRFRSLYSFLIVGR